jgi:acyl carrier protein
MIERIKKVISEIKEDPSLIQSLTETSDILNDVGLDSLQMIIFMMKLEEECDLELDFDNFNICHIITISRLSDFLVSQQNKPTNQNW